MSSEISAFTQTRLSRAIKGARKAGQHVVCARLFADGTIELDLVGEPPPPMPDGQLLDEELSTEEQLLEQLEALQRTAN